MTSQEECGKNVIAMLPCKKTLRHEKREHFLKSLKGVVKSVASSEHNNSNIRIKKKCYLCEFNCGTVAPIRSAGLSVSDTADLLGFFFSRGQFREFTQNGARHWSLDLSYSRWWH